jgi:hypothetical protein
MYASRATKFIVRVFELVDRLTLAGKQDTSRLTITLGRMTAADISITMHTPVIPRRGRTVALNGSWDDDFDYAPV